MVRLVKINNLIKYFANLYGCQVRVHRRIFKDATMCEKLLDYGDDELD
jgi:hypothetical protein